MVPLDRRSLHNVSFLLHPGWLSMRASITFASLHPRWLGDDLLQEIDLHSHPCRLCVGAAAMTATLVGIVSGDSLLPPPAVRGHVTAQASFSVHTEAGGGLSSTSLLPAGPVASPLAICAQPPYPVRDGIADARCVDSVVLEPRAPAVLACL